MGEQDADHGQLAEIKGFKAEGDIGEEVFLRIYDISNGAAKMFSRQLLGFEVDGVWHTAIEMFGNEYFFQNGVLCQPAGKTAFGACVERISLGHSAIDIESLHVFIEDSRQLWTPESYDLFDNNCNNYTNFLANFLLSKNIPSHILELPGRVKDSPFYHMFFNKNK